MSWYWWVFLGWITLNVLAVAWMMAYGRSKRRVKR